MLKVREMGENIMMSGMPQVTRLKICNRILEMNLLTRYLSFITNGNHMLVAC